MRTLSLILICCSMLSCYYSSQTSTPNGEVFDSIAFKGEAINNINVGSAFNVNVVKSVTQGDNCIELDIPSVLEPYLKTSLKNGELQVYLKNVPSKLQSSKVGKQKLKIYTNSFYQIKASGATTVYIEDKFECEELSLNLSGVSKIFIDSLRIEKDFSFELSGVSTLEIKLGEAISSNNSLRCSGTSVYNATNFIVKDLKVDLSGVSSAKVNVLNNLDIKTSGVSKLRYKKNESVRVNSNIKSVRSF